MFALGMVYVFMYRKILTLSKGKIRYDSDANTMPLHIYHFRVKGICAPNIGRNDLMGNTMGGNVVGV